MKHKKLKLTILLFPLLFIVAVPFIGIAAGYIPLEPLPGLQVDKSKGVELGSYFNNMYTLIIGIAGVLAVLMIVIAGIEYMSPTPSGKESGKKRAWAAIGGLVLALVSYLILQTINPDLLSTNFKLQEVVVTGEMYKVDIKKQQVDSNTTVLNGLKKISELDKDTAEIKTLITTLKDNLNDTNLSDTDKVNLKASIKNLEDKITENDKLQEAIQKNNKDSIKNLDFVKTKVLLQECDEESFDIQKSICRLAIQTAYNEKNQVERMSTIDALRKIKVDSTFIFWGDQGALNDLFNPCSNFVTNVNECVAVVKTAQDTISKTLKVKIADSSSKKEDIDNYKKAAALLQELERSVSSVLK